ncbi:SAM-dependent methyltransferase [Bailinhaonella thermotolerans]|uniref:SAM-dependent methyltransferase n=1 Tax=Bailinhaonella thermotolerans TaxID=1070861 RepID=A0A3A4ASZ4_9ACTN|nr:SAM-dependent methyltransferase [Bailinhaonella thermotolerans]RJL24478.1 SAM-dependent methyltransferase [Bailinhaonella thermotolerans]
MSELEYLPTGVDPHVPNPARMYDYYLGGKDNFAADREAAEKMLEIGRRMGNDGREIARANRAFLVRAVRLLAESGIRQFVDIGSGLPTQDNVHQVAARHASGARVVYVDNDPVVLAHARALLARDLGAIAVRGDAADPDAILDDPMVRAHLDLSRPYAVLMVAVLHFLPDDEVAARAAARVRARMIPGCHLVLSHLYTGDAAEDLVEAGQRVYETAPSRGLAGRDRAQIASFLGDLELLPPGLVPVQSWDPATPDVRPDYAQGGILAAVARHP